MLFTFVGGNGHFEPLLPIARAAISAGHTVAFAGKAALIPTVEAAGFTAFALGTSSGEPPKRLPLQKLDLAKEDRDLRDGFADRLARGRSAAVLALATDWQPDLIICDEVDFGGMIAAERAGIPYASVIVIAAGSFIRRELIAEPLNRVRAEHGLPPDPDLTMLSRYLVLSPCPPGFRDPRYPLPPTAYSIRPFDTPVTGTLPTWVAHLSAVPTVYFTLGTIFNLESGDLFQRVLAGLRDLPVNVIATVGRDIDPAEFGEQPPNVHIERYIPQALILPRCHLTVSHGGSGSVIGALAHGLPMVLIPMGADQPYNAARCEALGVGRALDAVDATPDSVREAVQTVLGDPRCRQAAERLESEIAGLPGAATAIPLLERLAAEKNPLTTSE